MWNPSQNVKQEKKTCNQAEEIHSSYLTTTVSYDIWLRNVKTYKLKDILQVVLDSCDVCKCAQYELTFRNTVTVSSIRCCWCSCGTSHRSRHSRRAARCRLAPASFPSGLCPASWPFGPPPTPPWPASARTDGVWGWNTWRGKANI